MVHVCAWLTVSVWFHLFNRHLLAARPAPPFHLTTRRHPIPNWSNQRRTLFLPFPRWASFGFNALAAVSQTDLQPGVELTVIWLAIPPTSGTRATSVPLICQASWLPYSINCHLKAATKFLALKWPFKWLVLKTNWTCNIKAHHHFGSFHHCLQHCIGFTVRYPCIYCILIT